IEADLVQPRGPHEQHAPTLVVETPPELHALEQRRRRRDDAGTLLPVDVITPLDSPHRPLSCVLVAQPAEHVVEQPLAKRTLARLEPVDPEALEHFDEDRDAAGENRRAIGAEPRQIEGVDPARGDPPISATL